MVEYDVPQVERWSYKQLASFFGRGGKGCRLIAPPTLKLEDRERIAAIVNMLELMRIEA
jgi:hypothetical protein